MAGEMAWILAVLAIVLNLISIWRFGVQIKERGVSEGKHLEEISNLRRDLEAAHTKIRVLENVTAMAKDTATEMKADIKYIMKTVEEIKHAFNEKWGGCV